MNIAKIREKIIKNKGKLFMFKFNGSRNQTEEFIGKIIEVYRSVFIIKVNDVTKRIRSFSYNDILTSSLEIKEIVMRK